MGKQEQFYEILGVKADASPKEVKRAYQDLTKVWQPDRFLDHPRLQRKAEEKLQEINEAYKQLQSLQRRSHKNVTQSGSRAQSVSHQTADALGSLKQKGPQSGSRPKPVSDPFEKRQAPLEPFVPTPLPRKPAPGWSVFLFLTIVAAVIVFRLIFTQWSASAKATTYKAQNTPVVASLPSLSSADLVRTSAFSPIALSAPQHPPVSAVKPNTPAEQRLETQPGSMGKRPVEERNVTEQADNAKGHQRTHKKTSAEAVEVKTTPQQTEAQDLPREEAEQGMTQPDLSGGYFTVGSTKDEVLALQGTPERFTETSFYYGTSEVRFEQGHVTSWYNGQPRLKVPLELLEQ